MVARIFFIGVALGMMWLARSSTFFCRNTGPAGILIGFDSEEAWFEYRLEHHPEFLARIQSARAAIRGGEGVRLEDLPA